MQKECRICSESNLVPMFSLGEQPLANGLLDSPNQEVKKYPLELYRCPHCTLIQLSHVVPKEEMFNHYLYIPSVSKTGMEHFRQVLDSTIYEANVPVNGLVVDI